MPVAKRSTPTSDPHQFRIHTYFGRRLRYRVLTTYLHVRLSLPVACTMVLYISRRHLGGRELDGIDGEVLLETCRAARFGQLGQVHRDMVSGGKVGCARLGPTTSRPAARTHPTPYHLPPHASPLSSRAVQPSAARLGLRSRRASRRWH